MTSTSVSGRAHRLVDDGITHINIYSRGKTSLGRMLSHFQHMPFVHPAYGPFYSLEGFWFYMRSGMRHDELRYVSGFKAKTMGKQFPLVTNPHFREDIVAANYEKIKQNSQLYNAVRDSTLPFDHYYIFGPQSILVNAKVSSWLVDAFEDIRQSIKNGVVPQSSINAELRYMSGQVGRAKESQ